MEHDPHERREWSRAKPIRLSHGFTFPQLIRLARDGLIRTSHIRRPGQTRGVRLFNVFDLDRLITESIEPPKTTPLRQSRANQSLLEKPDASGASVDEP
jgi:hypothetical protein